METTPRNWSQQELLLDLLRGYRPAQVLITGTELGSSTLWPAARPCTAEQLADLLQTDRRGIRLWLDAAVALGLLEKHTDLYANGPIATDCLVAESPHGLAQFVRREAAFYRRWSHLTAAVKTGRRPEENRLDEEPEGWVRDFELALYGLARVHGPVIAEALALPADRALRVLDVGGGHGGYSLALARRYPQLTAVVFVLPRVVPVALEVIETEGLGQQVTTQAGDFRTDPLGANYDLVLLLGVLNGEPPEGRAALIRKVFQALKPHGRIVVRELVLNPDRASPPDAALLALQMLLATERGGLSTSLELREWLLNAGIRPPETIALPGTASPLIVAEKPGLIRAD